jgi:hypothetical protein
MEIGQNFFSGFRSLSARPVAGNTPLKEAPSTRTSLPVSSAPSIKDEYLPSASDTLETYKPPAPIKLATQKTLENDEKRKAYDKTLTGRVWEATCQMWGDLKESLGITEPMSWSYHPGTDTVTGTIGAYYSDDNKGVPLSPQQASAFRNALKTTFVAGKSLAEWEATPKHVKDGFLYYEGDPALGVSLKECSVLNDLFKMSPVEELLEDLERRLLEDSIGETLEPDDVEQESNDAEQKDDGNQPENLSEDEADFFGEVADTPTYHSE